jgi:hypothetical protein
VKQKITPFTTKDIRLKQQITPFTTKVETRGYLLIQSYILGGEWGYFLYQPWWYIELFVDSTLHH